MPLKKTKHSIANIVNQTQSETLQRALAAVFECVDGGAEISLKQTEELALQREAVGKTEQTRWMSGKGDG